ncbi:MAG: DUF2279 domain-containing protein [Cyclobacteriaceae bacterium]
MRLLYLGTMPLHGNNLQEPTKKTNKKFPWILTGIAAAYGIIVLLLGTAWYADQMVQPFHFFNDLPEWKQLDKFAHALWAFHVCAISSRLLKWGGLDQHLIVGVITGFLIVSSIEILDGFSVGYGASIFDFLANALGALLFLVQTKYWNRIAIFPKFSFHFTSFAVLRPSLLGDGFFQEILKDYNGQTFWYTWSPQKKWWPSFLSIAIGIGAEGMVYGRDAENTAHNFSPYRKFFLSVDLNPNYFNPTKKSLKGIAYLLTMVKCPAPTIEISTHGIRFHWLYF